MEIMEQNKVDEKVMHLAEEHKKEKEQMHKKILGLQIERKSSSKETDIGEDDQGGEK